MEGIDNTVVLSKYRYGRMYAIDEDLVNALNEGYQNIMFNTIKDSVLNKEKLLAALDIRIEKILKESKQDWDCERLTTIPLVCKDSAACILLKLDNNMKVFLDKNHLAPWAGLCPVNNESGGKKVEE